MAILSFKQATIAGTDPAFVAASAGGDKVIPNDRGALIVRNASAAPITVTVVWPGNSKYGPANPDPTVSVPASGDRVIGPFGPDLADPIDGLIALTYSAVASVTVAAVTI